MEILIELSRALTKNKTKSIRVIDHFDKPHTKLEHFFDGLRSGRIKNDDEAISALYGSSITSKDKNKYYKLKYDLREKLINTIFFIDSNINIKSYKEIKGLELQKLMSAYRNAHKINAPKTKIWLLKRIIKIGIANDIYSQVRDACFAYCRNMFYISGQSIIDNEFYKTFLDYSHRSYLATKIEILFYDIQYKLTKEHLKTKIPQLIEDGLKDIEILPLEKRSFEYSRYFTFLNIIKFDALSEYRTCETICLDFINGIKRYSYIKDYTDLTVLINLIEALIQTAKVDKGLYYSEILLKQTNPSSGYYYSGTRSVIILFLKGNLIDEALNRYNHIRNNIPKSKISQKRKEYWRVMDGWLKWIKSIHDYNESKIEIDNDFKLYKLINDIPAITRDKNGLYINVLILEIAYLFLRKDFSKLIDKIEILHRFRLRYFEKETNLRTHLFIDVLMAYYKNNFKTRGLKEDVLTKIESIHTMLLTDSNQDTLLEIIPYEHIWDEIVAYIENR